MKYKYIYIFIFRINVYKKQKHLKIINHKYTLILVYINIIIYVYYVVFKSLYVFFSLLVHVFSVLCIQGKSIYLLVVLLIQRIHNETIQ